MEVYQASEWRHHFEYWETVEKWMNRTVGESTRENEIEMVAAACGLIFNVMGFLHEYLKDRPEVDFDGTEPTPEMAERQRKLSHDKYVEVNGVYGEGCTHGEQCDYNMTGCADCQIPNSQRKCEPKH